MTNLDRIAYWNSKPENAMKTEAGLVDRRVLIRHIAGLIGPECSMLEIGVNDGDVLAFCHDKLGSYSGVDISLERLKKVESSTLLPAYFEMPSERFWKETPPVSFDIIFIDGHHGTHESYMDMTQALLRLSKNGYVLAHDVDLDDTVDHAPRFGHNRIRNLPGWYSRLIDGHHEGLAIYFRA